jgi:cytochrome o ubiquinol oxidase subunit 3
MFSKGAVPSRSGFLSAFFGLVPLHGLHVTGGSIWLICLVGQIAMYGVDTQVKLGVMRLALFWHFLDIVWIAIFSVVYLAGLT